MVSDIEASGMFYTSGATEEPVLLREKQPRKVFCKKKKQLNINSI